MMGLKAEGWGAENITDIFLKKEFESFSGLTVFIFFEGVKVLQYLIRSHY